MLFILCTFKVSEELIRVAILWHELWHEGLEEASRLYFSDRNVRGMFQTLEPLHAMIERGPQTLKETSFIQVKLLQSIFMVYFSMPSFFCVLNSQIISDFFSILLMLEVKQNTFCIPCNALLSFHHIYIKQKVLVVEE